MILPNETTVNVLSTHPQTNIADNLQVLGSCENSLPGFDYANFIIYDLMIM